MENKTNKPQEENSRNKKESVLSLKQSPTFAMSLGAKELFHSNIWAWLINQDALFAKVFLGEEVDCSFIQLPAKREKNHTDIMITTKDNNVFVVENKLKSMPNEEQLLRYQEENNIKKGVLTALEEPCFLKGNKNLKWEFLSYSEIAKRLKQCLQKTTKPQIIKHKELFENYCNDILSIGELLNVKMQESKNVFDFSCEDLEDVNLCDVYRKLKSSDFFERHYKEILKHTKVPQNFELKCEQSFAPKSKKSILDFMFCLRKQPDKKQDDWVIGVQIEEEAFRLCVVWDEEKYLKEQKIEAKKFKEQVFKEFAEIGWFEKDASKTKTFKLRKTNMRVEFNSYGANFVYQHFIIPKDTTYEQVVADVLLFLSQAGEVIEKQKIFAKKVGKV